MAALLFLCCLTGTPARGDDSGCQKCHAGKGEGKFVHSPAAAVECDACHSRVAGKKHPGDKGAISLLAKGEKLCYSCHENMGAKKFVHSPVASGDCTSCHDPHGSANRMQLKEKGATLCLMCHEDKFKKRFGHPPAETGDCLACHDPHQSDNKALLKKHDSGLCFLCHDSAMTSAAFVHEPVAFGDCIACHNPHGSDYRKILKRDFPEELYAPYSAQQYQLCFDCHSSDMVMDRRTDTLTSFRNGDINLHYIHVNRIDKGRSCKSCHDPHSTRQASLIRDKITGFGKWDVPIQFTRNATGGKCLAGCHKMKQYDRLRPFSGQ